MEVEESIRSRISETKIKYLWTENSLAAGDRATQKRLNRQLSHDAAITAETILLVLKHCQDVSAEWLLRGEGAMERSTPSQCDASLREENQLLREEIIALHLELAQLRKQSAQKVAG